MTPDYKQQLLEHCIRFARIDREAGLAAADWYEAQRPWLLKNLRAKVEQELRRPSTSGPSLPVEGSTDAV